MILAMSTSVRREQGTILPQPCGPCGPRAVGLFSRVRCFKLLVLYHAAHWQAQSWIKTTAVALGGLLFTTRLGILIRALVHSSSVWGRGACSSP
jgi:hypothetical protein